MQAGERTREQKEESQYTSLIVTYRTGKKNNKNNNLLPQLYHIVKGSSLMFSKEEMTGIYIIYLSRRYSELFGILRRFCGPPVS